MGTWEEAASDHEGRARGDGTVRDLSLGAWDALGPGGRANHPDKRRLPSRNRRLRPAPRPPPAWSRERSHRSRSAPPALQAGCLGAPPSCGRCRRPASRGPLGADAYLFRVPGARRWHSTVVVECFPPPPISCLTSQRRGSLVWAPKMFTPFFTLALRAWGRARESRSVNDPPSQRCLSPTEVRPPTPWSRARFGGRCGDGQGDNPGVGRFSGTGRGPRLW